MSIAFAASRLANVFSGDVPSRVDPVLSLEGIEFTTLAYNDRGTYLAAGCNTGELVIWDLVTFTPALRVSNLHSSEINAATWVKKGKGRLICTTSSDGWIKVFDLEKRAVCMRLHFGDELVGAAIHPGNLEECLVCLGSNKEAGAVPWPGLYRMDQKDTSRPLITYTPRDFETNLRCYGVAATFSKHGTLVFVGGVAGAIFVFGTRSGEHIKTVLPDSLRGSPKGWMVALALSRNGRVLLSDGGGRAINVFEVALDQLYGRFDDLPADATVDTVQDAMRWRAGRVLTFKRHLQDVVGGSRWNDVGCSGHSEFVMGASAAQDVHEIFVWDVNGRLIDQLRDKNPDHGGISRCTWHPWRPQIAVITSAGSICLWNSDSKEELAFPPSFSEIEENITVEDAPEGDSHIDQARMGMQIEDPDPVDVLGNDLFPQVFSEDENSDEESPSIRTAPRSITRNIGYFIPSTSERCTVDASEL